MLIFAIIRIDLSKNLFLLHTKQASENPVCEKTLFIFPVCDSGIIAVTDGNSTLHAFFAAAIAYIWSVL